MLQNSEPPPTAANAETTTTKGIFQCLLSIELIIIYVECSLFAAAAAAVSNNDMALKQCGRFQFLCHSGECIAIYNACDGIPQCFDGSDEGPGVCI